MKDVQKQNSQIEIIKKNDIMAHADKMKIVDTPQDTIKWINYVNSLDKPLIIGCFLFYFLFGYLLYAALFAAVGSAVDSEADTQQFMMPITIPMILGFAVSQGIMTNPSSGIAQFFSIFPLTSPIVMMMRLPFEVPTWELATSMITLVLGFLFFTWLAGKIYRTGILMYGKKTSWKELGKWLFYKG